MQRLQIDIRIVEKELKNEEIVVKLTCCVDF